MEISCETPVIGILTMDLPRAFREEYGKVYASYMSASYVKFLESAGARVIPVWNDRNTEYYERIMSVIHGILIPGGSAPFHDPEHGKSSVSFLKIYKIAVDMNKSGIYFPIFGICLGFELLVHAAANGADETRYASGRMSMPLKIELKSDYRKCKLYHDLPTEIAKILESEPVAFHHHTYIVTRKILYHFLLHKHWTVTSLNRDLHNNEFVSSIEHKHYPFYGVAFHPEKPAFEFYPPNIPHTVNAIKVSQYFGNFFVYECCKNKKFFNSKKYGSYLIDNFPITFTGTKLLPWRQCYLFRDNVDYPIFDFNWANFISKLKTIGIKLKN